MKRTAYRLFLAFTLISGGLLSPDCVECKETAKMDCSCHDENCAPKPAPCQTILYSCELSPLQLPPSVNITAHVLPIQVYFPLAGAVLSVSPVAYTEGEFTDTSPPLYLRNNVMRI